jgi:predicted transcriptional regulator with HTH domain
MVRKMSSDLETILDKVIEEDCEQKELGIEKRRIAGFERFKSLLGEISRAKKWDLAIWVEGCKVEGVEKYEKDLNLLERGNLVKGETKFTERNIYREYKLTKKGSDLVKKLLGEP